MEYWSDEKFPILHHSITPILLLDFIEHQFKKIKTEIYNNILEEI
jgi:hypothetical protein